MQSITVRTLSQKEQHRETIPIGFGRDGRLFYGISGTEFGGRKPLAHLRCQRLQETPAARVDTGGAILH